jgi:cytochrome c oxidase subunit I+III
VKRAEDLESPGEDLVRGEFPNPLPRPPDELDRLVAAWEPPEGVSLITEVNNLYIGLFYIGSAMLFLVLGGILSLLMRNQLAFPDSELLDLATYNQLFTMHGTVLMFLFAVPVIEAMAIYLLPAMLAARDLPFPRLSAYAFWAYAVAASSSSAACSSISRRTAAGSCIPP